MASSKVLQVVLVHLVCNSALFLHLLLRVTCRSQFDLYLCSFSSAVSIFISSKISSFICGQKELFFRKNFISIDVSRCFVLFSPLGVQIPLPYKRMGRAGALCTFIFENFWTEVCLRVLSRIPSLWANYSSFVEYLTHFYSKFHSRVI